MTAASKYKEESKITATLNVTVLWEEAETEIAYYMLRISHDNTTGSAALYEGQPVRIC